MYNEKPENYNKVIVSFKQTVTKVNKYYLKLGFQVGELEKEWKLYKKTTTWVFIILGAIISMSACKSQCIKAVHYILGIRCILANNYFIWEATRPIKDCNFCTNVTEPIVLNNLTKDDFLPYAYTSKPIVIQKAFMHWPAVNVFSLPFFKQLYNKTDDGCRSVDEECQFLHFKSDFISIQDVFSMSEERSQNPNSDMSWYVGWGNCHPTVLEEMRKFYPKPHFLPDDCEIPSKEYVFMGYDDGATMHLDFINRLMWQAQLKGSKTWYLIPPPECQNVCNSLSFVVDPGDAVLVDTRVWYHATKIAPGQFSLSVQSEYGIFLGFVLAFLGYPLENIQNMYTNEQPQNILKDQ